MSTMRYNRLLCAAGVSYVILVKQSLNYTGSEVVGSPAVESSSPLSLKCVQVFFRHGARTPLKQIQGLDEAVYDRNFLANVVPHTEIPVIVQDINGGERPVSRAQQLYKNIVFKGGMTAGQLTSVGRDQAFTLGRRLAARYRDHLNFIGPQFNSQDIFVRSTNFSRCVDSAQCVVAGMFGKESFEHSEPALIHVRPLSDETLFPSSRYCDVFHALLNRLQSAFLYTPQYVGIFQHLQSHIGVSETYSGDHGGMVKIDAMQLRDQIYAREVHGIRVPECLQSIRSQLVQSAVDVLQLCVCGYIPDRLLEQTTLTLDEKFISESRTIGLRFAIGRALKTMSDVLEQASAATRSKLQPKMYLYACHDSSLAAMLLALGCDDYDWPPYVGDLIIEMYEDTSNGRHFVKVSYCGQDLLIGDHKKPMVELHEFLTVIRPYVTTTEEHVHMCSKLPAAAQIISLLGDMVTARTVSEVEDLPEVV